MLPGSSTCTAFGIAGLGLTGCGVSVGAGVDVHLLHHRMSTSVLNAAAEIPEHVQSEWRCVGGEQHPSTTLRHPHRGS